MKFATTSVITIAALASLAGCVAPVDSSEETGQTEQASSTGGVSATIAATKTGTQTWSATVVVTNNGNGAASNWQVALSMPGATVQSANGGQADLVGGALVLNPGPNGHALNAGSSNTITISGNYTGTYAAPTILSVDGEANGSAGLSPDGVDHIARTAASGALAVAFQYENNKVASNGDPNYAVYDGAIWAAQSYVISNGQIAFDPNMPGYQFIPAQAMAALATIQQDASVASYLVSGLASCFAHTDGNDVYYFKTATLKGFPNTTSGTLPGGPGSGSGSSDTFTVASKATTNGAEVITVTENTTKDSNFGMLTAQKMSVLANNYSAISAKFTVGNTQMCSPFNGPGGGTANPYLVITLNGQAQGARQQQAGVNCQGVCQPSTIVLDPIAYTVPGPQYDVNNNLLGPQNNPFALDPTDVYADPTHYMSYSTNPAAQYGTFSHAMTFFGQPVDRFLVCGTNGSGC